MIRFGLHVTLFCLIGLGMALFITQPISQLRPLHPVMAGLDSGCEGKTQPCWYGVALRETTTSEVEALFSAMGDHLQDNPTKYQLEINKTTIGGCFAQFIYGRGEARIINEIILTNCERVRLGDLLARYGEPETLGTTITCDRLHAIIQHDNYYIEYPADGIIAAINRPVELSPWLSLQGNVRQLYLVKPRESDGRKTWSGIVSFSRFIRLHPEQIRTNGCGP